MCCTNCARVVFRVRTNGHIATADHWSRVIVNGCRLSRLTGVRPMVRRYTAEVVYSISGQRCVVIPLVRHRRYNYCRPWCVCWIFGIDIRRPPVIPSSAPSRAGQQNRPCVFGPRFWLWPPSPWVSVKLVRFPCRGHAPRPIVFHSTPDFTVWSFFRVTYFSPFAFLASVRSHDVYVLNTPEHVKINESVPLRATELADIVSTVLGFTVPHGVSVPFATRTT